MKEITFYVADDGTRFDDEYECKEYEEAMTFSHFKGVMLDDNMEATGIIYDVYYVSIPSEEDYRYLKDRFDDEGYDYPPGVGYFHYDTRLNKWVDLEKEYQGISNALAKLGKFKSN